MQPKILLTGRSGQIGYELFQTLSPLADVLAVDVQDVDLSNVPILKRFVRNLDRIDLIVHPAAFTAVDLAEEQPDLARAVNVDASRVLAEEAAQRNIPMIHYSTDYVFDGNRSLDSLYTEKDATAPLSVYGLTKRDGETAVREICKKHCILRLCWVYGLRGNNFFQTMLRLYQQGKTPQVVDDQIGAPTWSRIIAIVTAILAGKILDSPSSDFPWGTYHVSAGGVASWHEFATAIFVAMNHQTGQKIELPKPISSEEYSAKDLVKDSVKNSVKATRPKNSRLDNNLLAVTFGLKLPDWQTQLAWCLDAIKIK
ncbi:MAG: dTDP-4-dehydrorhamnose reductase [Planctomycetaceae bacterium]|jgi:dTDP-4-dehydrorhamnose reductase|nr:dTDP-4-dehydrorhamnose reductase [Planctomycetaceae bacterium]